MHGICDDCIKHFSRGNMNVRQNLGDLDVDGMSIFKWILGYGDGDWIQSFRIRSNGDLM